MPAELTNGFGQVDFTVAYDAAGPWVHINRIGYQTFAGIIVGPEECLHPLREHGCTNLLNDNRQAAPGATPWRGL